MSDQQSWQENNTRYLSTALTWLRLRLEKLTLQHPAATTPPQQPASEANIDEDRRPRFVAANADLSAPELPTASAELAECVSILSAIESRDQTPPALLILSQRLGLTRFEQELLL